MKCDQCNSDSLESYAPDPAVGLWRSFFYTAYLCRKCGRRFMHRNSALLLAAMASAVLAVAALGLFAFWPQRAPEVGVADLKAAAEAGDAMAQLRLGMEYLNGSDAAQDPAIGVKWVERAANQGYAEAQYRMGVIMQSGVGAPQSFPLAFEWFERAAQQNHAEAQYRLGLMYRQGDGVAGDRAKAYFWFVLAAAQKHEFAASARDNLLSALPRDQVLALQRAAHEWKPTRAAMVKSGPSAAVR